MVYKAGGELGLEKQRVGCMLQGALDTIYGIKGVVPIIHSTAGCGIQKNARNRLVPSTNLIEKQIVFGGASRLREQIKNTIAVINAQLYVIVTGCAAELIGDDSEAMAKESREQGNNVIYINTAGFKGHEEDGYVKVVLEIINYLNITSESNISKTGEFQAEEKPIVNLLGVIPSINPFYKGELNEIKRILEGCGIKVNTIFGVEDDLKSFKAVTKANLNICVSKAGVKIAKELKKKFSIDYINLDYLPIGYKETEKWIGKVKDTLRNEGIELKDNKFLSKEKEEYLYYLRSFTEEYFKINLQRGYTLVSDYNRSLALYNFLSEILNRKPEAIFITDSLTIDEQKDIKKLYEVSRQFESSNIYFTEGINGVEDVIKNTNSKIIFGSNLEKGLANKFNIPLIEISAPVIEGRILSKGYVGYNGGLNLIEDIVSEIINNDLEREEKNKKYLQSILL